VCSLELEKKRAFLSQKKDTIRVESVNTDMLPYDPKDEKTKIPPPFLNLNEAKYAKNN